MSSLIRISDWFDSLINNLILNYVDDLCVLECVPQGLILEMGHELLAQILSKKMLLFHKRECAYQSSSFNISQQSFCYLCIFTWLNYCN